MKSVTVTTADASRIVLTTSSELMKNQTAASAIDPQHAMKAIEDTAGQPMLFSIGNDGVLHVTVRSPETRTGWKQYDLTSAIGGGAQAMAFQVAQGSDGRLILGVVTAPVGQPEKCTLHLTPRITNDATLTDWSAVGKQWVARPLPDGDGRIHTLRIDIGTGGGALGVAVVQRSGAAEQYLVNPDALDDTWTWKRFPLPQNALASPTPILAPGMIAGDLGVFALYSTSTGQTLDFTSLPDPVYHRVSRYEFPLPARITSIATLSDAGPSTNLYAAGDGIYVFPQAGDQAQTIATKEQIGGIHHIVVSQDAQKAAVFAVAGDQRLFLTEGPTSDFSRWAPPAQLQSAVSQITAIRHAQKVTNQLFAVTGGRNLTLLYQDPSSGLWKDTPVQLPSIGHIVEFTTYTTHVHVADPSGRPLINATLRLSASSWTYLVVNGISHTVDQDQAVDIVTDFAGNVTIVNPVRDVASPVLHLQCGGSGQIIDIHPASKVREGLESMKSGSDLAKATLADGTPLLTRPVDGQTLDGAANGLQALLAAGDAQAPSMPTHFAERLANAAAGREAAPPGRQASAIWGMTFDSGSARYLSGSAAAHTIAAPWKRSALAVDGAAEGPVDPIGDLSHAIAVRAGDAIAWIEQQIKDVGAFLVRMADHVAQFFVELGGTLYQFVLDTAEATYKVISWVLEKTLGIDLDKVVEWLGFIFNWEDIKRTHRFLVKMADATLDFGRSQVRGAEQMVSTFFEDLKDKARTLGPQPAGGQNRFALADQQKAAIPAAYSETAAQLQDSPGANWGGYHLLHSGTVEDGTLTTPSPSNPLDAFVQNTLWPLLASVEATATQLAEDFKIVFEQRSLTDNGMIGKITSDAAVGLLDIAEKIVVGLLTLVEDLVKLLQEAINTKIEIPFFSAFYRTIADADLSVLDAIMLIMAIPVTVSYKIVTGRAPVPAEGAVFETEDYQAIFKDLSGSRPAPIPARRDGRVAALDALVADDTPGPEKEEPAGAGVSDAARTYSIIGGFVYSAASLAEGILGLIATVKDASALQATDIARMEALEHSAVTFDTWKCGMGVAKIALSYPVGSEPEVVLQRSVWGVSLVAVVVESLTVLLTRLGKLKAVVGKIKGVVTLLKGLAVFILENIIYWKYEHDAPEKQSEQSWLALKYAQNWFYFGSEMTGGAAALIPGMNQVKGAVMLASGALVFFASAFDFSRVIVNLEKAAVHHNF